MSLFGQSPQFSFEGTLTFASVATDAANWTDQTVTLPTGTKFPSSGASGTTGVGGGLIHLELPDLQANLAFCNARVLSPTTFKVRFFNATVGALTPTGTNARLVMF